MSAAVAHGIFKSGREHYELAGRVERREGASVPSTWDEQGYLQANPEVVSAVSRGTFLNGYHHYLAAGRVQGRIGGLQPADWDEAGYLAATPTRASASRWGFTGRASSTTRPSAASSVMWEGCQLPPARWIS